MTAQPQRILVPADGSENALRAVKFAIGLAKGQSGTRIELVNVQPPLGGTVSMFVAKSEIKGYHRDEGMKALGTAIDALKASGVPFAHHIGVGQPGEVIAAFAKELGCSQIVMGTRGLGATLGLLLGSVATDVVKHATIPVTLVK
jgi:nucleotide-binding universal stress UspA family protein